MHYVSYAFCPIIFGGLAVFASMKWRTLERWQVREALWSLLSIILAILVIVFVGLNTFLWQSDLLFYIFIPSRFTLLLFFAILANPFTEWSPLRKIFTTPAREEKL
jgi:hypothetical protein